MSSTSTPDDRPPLDAERTRELVADARRLLREYRKAERLAKLAKGIGKPRTMRETEIWMRGLRERHGLGGDGQAAGSGHQRQDPGETRAGASGDQGVNDRDV